MGGLQYAEWGKVDETQDNDVVESTVSEETPGVPDEKEPKVTDEISE